jgi:hypothetical protein
VRALLPISRCDSPKRERARNAEAHATSSVSEDARAAPKGAHAPRRFELRALGVLDLTLRSFAEPASDGEPARVGRGGGDSAAASVATATVFS